MRRLLSVSILVWLAASSALEAFGATYYVDYVGGSDSNNGTATGTPWKLAPGMVGFAASYSHVAGDKFIFKGGVSWPRACFQWNVSNSGSGASWDYYGADKTYFTGGAWSRPKFDAQNQGNSFMIMTLTGDKVFLDNLEFLNMAGGTPYGGMAIDCTPSPNGQVFSNLYMHSWTRGTATGDGAHGGIYFEVGAVSTENLTNVLIAYCTIDNFDGGADSGVCLRYPGQVDHCKLGNAPELILHGGWSIHDSELYNVTQSWLGDSAQHPNTAYWDGPNGDSITYGGPVYFYNNFLHDLTRTDAISPIYVEPAFGGPLPALRDCYIYNNVFTNSSLYCVQNDSEQYAGGKTVNVHIFNNTFYNNASSHSAIHNVLRGTPNFDLLDCRNNLVICPNANEHENGLFNTITSSNAVSLTEAAANSAGYYRVNYYAPTNVGATVVAAGVNLSSLNLPGLSSDTTLGGLRTANARPGGSTAWDVGAFQFGSVDPNITKNPQNQSVALASDATFSVTATGGTTLHYAWTFNAGAVGSDSSSYTRTNCQLADSGGLVRVTVSDVAGSIISTTVTLTVTGGGGGGGGGSTAGRTIGGTLGSGTL
jgi:hypothetical protein